ncbi:NAD-P-binding protein [Stereum hirsutum FP-91666 SS1]|uniref:NAD-P-binding protein n=1 Tax=Stereum hirsutum (strain FP-91666) TaxID=721885 RepID=UPI000444977D|nr:NAD-P-binding protein [Stereum hirsutum FP-91666 SS1]EIM81872.1 NAD-P-binding protein [Stereum hirsutum FP-91666 SS1]
MGNLWSVVSHMFTSSPKWATIDIPDLSGKVMIATGGNSGVGKEIIKALLEHNAKVYMASRSPDRAQGAIQQLRDETGKEALYLHLDLADLTSVRKSAEEFLSKETELHVLFNNAAVMACPVDELTKQGYDMQIGSNVLGHFLFTELLMPALLNKKARVVTTSSSGAYLLRANVIVARELARRYGDKGIVSISVNPGNLNTNLQKYLVGVQKWIIVKRLLYPAHYGALTQLCAGTSPATVDYNGKFLISWARLGEAPAVSGDPHSGKKLWEWLDQQCSGFYIG